MKKVAFIVDGGYFTRCFSRVNGGFPSAEDVRRYVDNLHEHINKNFTRGQSDLYRVFFYDCAPLGHIVRNPANGAEFNFSKSSIYRENQRLQENLKRLPFFALRLGELMPAKGWNGWKPKTTIKDLVQRTTPLLAEELVPDVTQKGVDMRIGLDIASIAAKRLCDIIVLISADTDMIPAMKLARKEGLQVFLHTFWKTNNPNFHAHADVLIHHDMLPQ